MTSRQIWVTVVGAAVVLGTAALLLCCDSGDNTPATACAGYCAGQPEVVSR